MAQKQITQSLQERFQDALFLTVFTPLDFPRDTRNVPTKGLGLG